MSLYPTIYKQPQWHSEVLRVNLFRKNPAEKPWANPEHYLYVYWKCGHKSDDTFAALVVSTSPL
jgi:hypothetical protein